MLNIRYEETQNPKPVPGKDDPLVFGTIFTDHMFVMDYEEGKGWYDPRVVPYGPIVLDPSAMILHYGQEVFEGLKAYPIGDGRVQLFRPDKNAERFSKSNDRLRVPEIPKEDFLQAVKAIVKMDKKWIPDRPGTALYIRPFVIATEASLNVRPAKTYKFMIILSPVGPYYPEGLNPVKIWIEDEYVRAVRGGVGEAKTSGNYAASIFSVVKAHDAGYSEVLWLDGVERKYIEEVGAMNIFFKIKGKVLTPVLNGSILPGVTRDSCLQLLREWGEDVEERRISIDELLEAARTGSLEEVWGTGTAAVISPVGYLRCGEEVITINDGKIGALSQKLYDTITGIQLGKVKGPEGWTVEVE